MSTLALPRKLKGIIFDCDGVLLDSRHAHMVFYNRVRSELDLPPLTKELEDFVHIATFQQALDAIVPVPLRPALRDILARPSLQHIGHELIVPMAGIHELVDACLGFGLRMAVHTNRHASMPEIVKVFHFEGKFDPIITVEVAPAKPSPEGTLMILREWKLSPEEVAFVGDGSTDEGCAHRAGVFFVALGNKTLNAPLHCASHKELLEYVRLSQQ